MNCNPARVTRGTNRRRLLVWAAALLTLACSGGLTDVTPVAGTAVNSIVITPSAASLALGDQLPLQAVATDANGKVMAAAHILWTIRDTAVASISPSGVVSAKAVGSTQVAASADGHSAVATLTVAVPAVASVVVAPTQVDVVVGAKTQFTVVTLDGSQRPLSGRAITWTSTNEVVATVDASGNMTARSAGAATIIATSEGKSASASVTVTQAPVAALSITPNPLSMSVGQSTRLTAVATDAAGSVVTGRSTGWSSSDPSIASVSTAGIVTAIAAGSVRITATVEGKTAVADVAISNFAVGSVSVQPQDASVIEHSSMQLSAVVLDVTGSPTAGRVVSWTSSDDAVATVSNSGLVTGMAPGSATITATSEGKSGSATVSVTAAPAAKVVLSAPATNITVGQSFTIGYAVLDAGGLPLAGRIPVWSSSNTSIASVSSRGVVNAIAPGPVVISATFEGKIGTAALTVVAIPVGSVVTAPSSANVTVGQTVSLSATPKDASGNALRDRVIDWSTSDPAIASVSSTGVVTGLAAGSATITATSGGKAGSTAVTVSAAPVASIAINPETVALVAGQTATLVATPKDAAGNTLTGRTVAWSSNATGVATVSSAGVVNAVAPGSATITATSEGKGATASVTVSAVPVATVVVTPPAGTIFVGGSTSLTATLKDAAGNVLTGHTVTWSSSKPSVATVSSTGVVTAIASGSTTITATSGTASGAASITVTVQPVATMTLAPATATLVEGQTVTLVPIVKDAGGNVLTGRAITWSTDKSSVATVSSSGVVTAVGQGTANVTATSEGKNATVAVTVTAAPAASVTISPASANVTVGYTTILIAVVRNASGAIIVRPVTWTSLTSSVASVSSLGLVTGVVAGTTRVVAMSGTASDTATITVTPRPVASITLSPSSASLVVGATTGLTPTLKDEQGNVLTGRTVRWRSETPSVATVSTTGVVTAAAPGTTTITATSGTVSGTATITVTVPPVSTVTVVPGTARVKVGKSIALTATLKDAGGNLLTGRTVTWKSSTPSIATVLADGTVHGIARGSAIITATSEGKSGTAELTVTP